MMVTRAELRLKDLQVPNRGTSKLMNVKIPLSVSDGIHKVAQQLGVSKTDVVIALLNEGLDVTVRQLKNWKPPTDSSQTVMKACSVEGCGKAHAAKGLWINHYQAVRRGKLRVKRPVSPIEGAKHTSKRRVRRRRKRSTR